MSIAGAQGSFFLWPSCLTSPAIKEAQDGLGGTHCSVSPCSKVSRPSKLYPPHRPLEGRPRSSYRRLCQSLANSYYLNIR